MGFDSFLNAAGAGGSVAFPPVGAVVAAFRPVEQIFGSLGHALGIGGHTQAEKDAERVRRADQLAGCAVQGNVEAARRVLFGANNTHSTSPAGVAEYQRDWQQLQGAAPSVVAAAVRAGPAGDSGDASSCPPDGTGPGPLPGLGSSVLGQPGGVAGRPGIPGPVLAGGAMLLAALALA